MMQYTIFGHGCLEDNMRYKKISFSSLGAKFLCLILVASLCALNIALLIYIEQIPWYAICYSIFVLLFCLFGCYICFNHNIIIDYEKNILKICNLKNVKVSFEQINCVNISVENSLDPRKYCHILFNLKDGQSIKYSEYFTLIKANAVAITRDKIKQLSESIPSIKFIY